MTPSLAAPTDAPDLIVPAVIEAVIADFSQRSTPFSIMDVHGALCAARQTLADPSPEENKGAWAEVLAFGLAAHEHVEKPWGTYFGPMGSGPGVDGAIVYLPDATQADASILAHWKHRAATIAAPVLAARYNDLVWDMAKLIASERRRDVSFARAAIDAYLVLARGDGRDLHDAFPAAERALELAIVTVDEARRDAARAAILALHARALAEHQSWWRAWDILTVQPRAGLTDAELATLTADLEADLARASDVTPGNFNPHNVEDAANRLIPHYRRLRRAADVERVNLAVARAFEHFGRMGDPLLASMVFHTSMEAYRAAGRPAEEARLLQLIEESNVAATAQMTRHEFRQEVPVEDVEAFLAQIITPSKEETFRRIAQGFMMLREPLQQRLEESARESPLQAFIPFTVTDGRTVTASIGALDDDPIGRLIFHAKREADASTFWLRRGLRRAREQHALTLDDFCGWVNRTGLFGDGTLLQEGVTAWLAEDHCKAAHVLVPQVEAGLRALLSRLGRPTTKAHRDMPQARVVITMGELLHNGENTAALGPNGTDFVLHFRCLYTDPRGENWRNGIAHGLLSANRIHSGMTLWVIHSLLLLGSWLRPAEAQPENPSPPAKPANPTGDHVDAETNAEGQGTT